MIFTSRRSDKLFDYLLISGGVSRHEINQPLRSALLNAAHKLRQNPLRGQIWGQDGEQEDNNYESFSTSSSRSSMGSNTGMHYGTLVIHCLKLFLTGAHRGRPESGSGRVQGMVASFERNGPSRPTSYINVLPVDSAVLNPESDMLMTTTTIETLAPPAIINADSDHQKEPRLLPLPPPSVISSPEHSTPLEQHMPQGSRLPAFGPYPSSQDFSFPPPVVSPQVTGATLSLPDDFSDHIDQARQINPGIALTSVQQPQSSDAFYMNALGEGVRPLPLPPHASQFYQPLAFPAMSIPLNDHMGVGVGVDSGDGVPGPADQMQMPHVSAESTNTVPHVQLPYVPDSSRSLTAQVPSIDIQDDIHQQQLQPQLQLAHLQQSDPVHSHSPRQIPSHLQSQAKKHHHQLSHSGSMPIQILAPQPRHGGPESPTKILEEKLEELLEPRPRSRVFSTQQVSRPHSRVPSSSKKDNLSLPGSRPRSRVASMSNDKSVAPSVKSNLSVVGDEMSDEVTAGAEENMDTGSDRLNVPNTKSHHPRTRVISVSTQMHSHRLSGVEAWGENHRHVVVPSSSPSSFEGILDPSTLPFVEGQGVKELEGEEEMGIEALLEKEVSTISIPVPVHNSNPMPGSNAGLNGADLKQSDMGIAGSGGTESIAHSRSGSLREPKSAVITLVENIPSPRADISHAEEGGEVGVMEEESIEALSDKVDSLARSGGALKRTNKKRTPLNDVEAWNMVDINTVECVDGDGHVVMSKSVGDAPPSSSSELRSSHASQKLEQASACIPVVPSLSPKELEKADSKFGPMRLMDGPDWTPNVARLDELERKGKELEKSMAETRAMVGEVQKRLQNIERWICEKEKEGQQRMKEEEAVNGRGQEEEAVKGKEQEEEEAIKGKEQEEKGYACWMKRRLSASRVSGMLGLSIYLSGSSSVSSSSSTSTSTLKTQNQMTLIRRIAKLGLRLSTYVALFGICVVFLRALGKRSRYGSVSPKLLADGGELVFRGWV